MKPKKLIMATAFALLLAASNIVYAGPLDQPATKQITVGSEIRRGDGVAYHCWMNNYSNDLAAAAAIANVIAEEMRANTDTDAFYIGLYFEAWLNMDLQTSDRASNGTQYTAKDVDYCNETAKFYFRQYTAYRQRLNLTDDDVFTALAIRGNTAKLKERMNVCLSNLKK